MTDTLETIKKTFNRYQHLTEYKKDLEWHIKKCNPEENESFRYLEATVLIRQGSNNGVQVPYSVDLTLPLLKSELEKVEEEMKQIAAIFQCEQ